MNISKLYLGRPSEEETRHRLEKEIRVYDLLDELEIPYHRLDHDEAMTIDVCQEIDARLEATICKNLFLCNRQRTEFHLLMLPGHKKMKTKEVSKQLGSARLSFAKSEDLLELLDITPGSVSVMGLMNDHEKRVNLVVDGEILESDWLGCHPCVNTASLRIAMKDLVEKFLAHTGHEMTVIEVAQEEA